MFRSNSRGESRPTRTTQPGQLQQNNRQQSGDPSEARPKGAERKVVVTKNTKYYLYANGDMRPVSMSYAYWEIKAEYDLLVATEAIDVAIVVEYMGHKRFHRVYSAEANAEVNKYNLWSVYSEFNADLLN